MRSIIYTGDKNTSEKIKHTITEIIPDAIVTIAENSMDCFTRGESFNYAFVTDSNDGLPWTDLISHLSSNGVRVYFITDVINKNIIKSVTEAGGLSAISMETVEQDIKALFINFIETDDLENDLGDSEDEEELTDTIDTTMNSQEYVQLKSRKYPAVIVSMHGAKGGVGKTCIAINTAVELNKMGLKTIAIDFDIENGNLATVLHMNIEKDLKDIIKGNFNYNDETSFMQHPCGLYVMPGLKIPAESDLITPEICERILGRLARIFDVIVIDTGSIEIDPMLIAMQISTKTYFVCNCDMTAIAKTYDMIEDVKMLGVDLSKAKLIINRMVKGVSLDKSFINEYINMPILSEIPETKGVLRAINNGNIPVESLECRKFRAGVLKIAKDIVNDSDLKDKISENSIVVKKKGLFKLWAR